MKSILRWMFILSFLLTFSVSFAMVGQSGTNVEQPSDKPPQGNGLDETCTIDYVGLVNGGGMTGTVIWPDGEYGNSMGILEFTNSCTPGVPLYAYCTDISHTLNADPYCVVIENDVVNPLYPEQFPAMAYIMTWYPSGTPLEDDIQQLSVWKMTTEKDAGSANYGVPYYHIDADVGYPLLEDPAVYPYVNTLHHSDPAINDPANAQVLDGLGFGGDGIAKNVVMAGDGLLLSHGSPVEDNGNAVVTVSIQLTRGLNALAAGNVFLEGVKLLVSTDGGALSDTELFTDVTGLAQFTVTQPIGSPGVTVQICSYGLWPKSVQPCQGEPGSQALVVHALTSGAVDTVCADRYLDWFLPAELVSFEVIGGENEIILVWRSASESNMSSWEVERRAEGSSFNLLAQIPAANASNGHTYRYADESIQYGFVYDYRLVDVDVNGVRTVHGDFQRSASSTGNSGSLFPEYRLADNYPNPFNPVTHISFALAEAGFTSLKVYDIVGKEVATLMEGQLEAGEHSATFKASNLPSGIYFYSLSSGTFSQTKKMILMK